MRKQIQTLMAVCLLTGSLAAFAQSGRDMKQGNMQPDQTKPDQMKANDTKKDGLGCPCLAVPPARNPAVLVSSRRI